MTKPVQWATCRECGRRVTRGNSIGICHSSPECRRAYQFVYQLMARYGLSANRYYRLLAEQEGQCAICGIDLDGLRPCVDHDHDCCPGRNGCGKCVRGLLCVPCNVRLGVLEDRKFIRAAKEYLARSGEVLDVAELTKESA